MREGARDFPRESSGSPYANEPFVAVNCTAMPESPRCSATCEVRDISDTGVIVGFSGSLATLWTIETPPPTPEAAIQQFVADVESLVTEGTLTEGRGNALLSQLEAITRQAEGFLVR